ncbi:AT-rich interactive domain-containing protein 5B-like [Neocloeon triangulifer]|uniref:AT-rich interactive domain-containing protein 5B-like n=1 Tax=Neocloeon triangulifer TaxID=2078957 RepID=UPI00286F067F|nr:AT-rich interactive domain-containing protein 5B-like [Neocloeon triangulifer]
MDNAGVQLVGDPCNRHGPYTFYKAFRYVDKCGQTRTISISEFFFVKIWNDSDLVSIGELQLLWQDKNSDNILSSLRLYFLPENTPEGRNEEHGEDEVMAITEKVVLKVDDLISWIIAGSVEWRWGHRPSAALNPVKKEEKEEDTPKLDIKKDSSEPSTGEFKTKNVMVMSFPRYCRYRSMFKRMEGDHKAWKHAALIAALGGLPDFQTDTTVLFCRDNFDYPELETHELLCNHLAPKFAGRPRKKKRRNASPGSESNESEGSSYSVESLGKVKRLGLKQPQNNRPGAGIIRKRGGPRKPPSKQEAEFLQGLYAHMIKVKQPIDKVPSLGFKQLDLYAFYMKVRELGGYKNVTTKRMWKRVYDELGGSQTNTSAATCTRKHYERLLLVYENRLIEESMTPKKRGRKPKDMTLMMQQLVSQASYSASMTSTTSTGSVSPGRRKSSTSDDSPSMKKRKLEILAKGGLDIRPVATGPPPIMPEAVLLQPRTQKLSSEVSITVTPDVSHMIDRPSSGSGQTFKPPPQRSVPNISMFSRTGRVYGNPKVFDLTDDRPDGSVLDLTIKPVPKQLSSGAPTPRGQQFPDVSILPQNGHHLPNKSKKGEKSGSSLEITLVPAAPSKANGSRGGPKQGSKAEASAAAAALSSPYNQMLLHPESAAIYYNYNAALSQMLSQSAGNFGMPGQSLSPQEFYKNLLSTAHLPGLLACLNQASSFPGLPRDGSTSITPLPRSSSKQDYFADESLDSDFPTQRT